ncbi:MAG: Stp1/IreP family PP2C-type Ser/Thr phosphatase [Deltaproteobacteria bacterium]|nr:Stp1/IreP family PP2C-type Ser/Thr phosphatase [Deltaproteobacteria bacterium]
MRLEVAGKTHVGMKRNHNEDNLLLLPEENLFCVADGMGGHASGEIASKIAVTEVSEFFKMTSKDQEATWPFKMDKARSYDENRLATGIKLANSRIFEESQNEAKYRGMGTTIVSSYFVDAAAFVGHVGDSRVYRFIAAEQKLVQVTEDHSLLNDYIRAKKLTPEEIENFPHKNVIVRALGMKDSVQVDVSRIEPGEGDIFLLCSDGLSGMVPDPKMNDILQKQPDIDKASSQLIDAANAAGGADNVTCVLVRWHAS